MTTDGFLQRYIVWDDNRLVRAPEHMSMEEASSLFTAGVTAYRALFYGPMKPEPGTTVLTQGTGGVSCFAIQIAAAAGATVIATSSSDEKLEAAQKLGAKHLLNYQTDPDWHLKVLELTNNTGVDLVLDVVGAQSIEQTLKATRFGGAVVSVGVLSKDPTAKVDILLNILYGARTFVGQLGAGSRDMLDEMCRFMEKRHLKPQIAEVFEWEEADKALDAASKLTAAGKVVVKV